MFNNVGNKIKNLAKVLFWIGVAASVIGAALLMFATYGMITIGIAVLIVGPLFSWIGSWMLYGYGELIDTNVRLAKDVAKALAKTAKEEAPTAPATWFCPRCGRQLDGNSKFCLSCGAPRL